MGRGWGQCKEEKTSNFGDLSIYYLFKSGVSFKNEGALIFDAPPAPPAVPIGGSVHAGQVRGLMTANLPEVGAAQAAGSAGPAFAAIWAGAAVSITLRAQMCQPNRQSSVGRLSHAWQLIASLAADAWRWVLCKGLPGPAEGQLSSRLSGAGQRRGCGEPGACTGRAA